jgi:hypothetical protein
VSERKEKLQDEIQDDQHDADQGQQPFAMR